MIDDLYDLIGGSPTIWAATDSFYRRVLEDESLRRFFDSSDMAHLRERQSMFVSMLLGGKVERRFQQTCDRKSSSHYPISPVRNLGKPRLEAFVTQLREARAE
jgi:truncated hemoglobin YjbI